MTDLLTPATAPVPADMRVTGYVCVDGRGPTRWSTARSDAEASMLVCFGFDSRPGWGHLARVGWRCVPIFYTEEVSLFSRTGGEIA